MKVDVRALLTGMIAENTIQSYVTAWNAYLKFAGSAEKALNGAMLTKWRQELTAGTSSASTINSRLAGIKSIARELYNQRRISRETNWDIQEVKKLPGNALKERRRPNNRTRVEPEQMRKLCKLPAVSDDRPLELRDRALMMVLATTGARISEVLAMRVRDIHALPNNKFVIMNVLGKTDAEPRTVPLSPEAHSAILDWIEFRPIQSPYIFSSFHYDFSTGDICFSNKPMSRNIALRRVKLYGKMIGLPSLKCHDFRRFVGTQLAKKDIRVAQLVLGHASIDTTVEHYVLDEFQPGTTDNLF